MKNLFFLVFTISFCLFSCSEKIDHNINYIISPAMDNDTALLKINMDINAGVNGETVLLYQDKGWGQDSLHNVLSSLKVLNTEATITTQRDSGWVVINHPKDIKKIEFEYILKQDTKGKLTTRNTYRPIINKDYFHVFAHNLLMLPKETVRPEGNLFDVNITWEGFPQEYALVNSFGSNNVSQHIEHISEEDIHSAIFVGGDFRVHDMAIEEKQVVFAIRDEWKVFNDSTITAILEKTVRSQRDLWQDHTQDYFAITMIPTFIERGSSFQGTGLTNSFAVNATNNDQLQAEGLVYLFNHELQHNWTGKVIKNDDEEKQYWFSEGFTDYYTLKNIAKETIYGLDGSYYINEFNTFIRELYTSPVKEMPNSALTYETFWSGQEGVQKLPYRRGALFAFYLDNKIKQDSNGEKSLDDVLLTFKNDAINSNQKIDHPYFISVINKYVKEDIDSFFDTHIEQGRLFNFAEMLTTFGYEFNPTGKVFDLGFEFSEDRKTVASIDPSLAAYKAGLRAGDKLTSISYYNAADYPATFKVLRNGKEIDIEYLPARDAEIPQLIDSDLNKKRLTAL